MLFVFQNTVFSGLQVHGPAVIPFMGFTWSVIQDVTRVSVLQASNFNPLEFDRLKDFGGFTLVTKLFSH